MINKRLNRNFFDFVNEHRVQEAKRRLAHIGIAAPNILTIALEAGFNSKSAFYTAFRKHTGMTPTAFRKGVKR